MVSAPSLVALIVRFYLATYRTILLTCIDRLKPLATNGAGSCNCVMLWNNYRTHHSTPVEP